MSLAKIFAARVRETREAAELTQEGLAKLLRVPRTNVVRLENDPRDVRLSTVEAVAKALKVPPGRLLEKS